MTCFSEIFFLFALAPLLGCNQGATGEIGVGDPKANKSVSGRGDDTFSLSVPLMLTSLQQGTQAEGIIGISRAKNFDDDVTLEFKNIPAGVTIQPAHPTFKHGDSDSKVLFVVDDSAAKGEFKIEISGHPKQGAAEKIDFRFAVTGRDSFSLNTPLLSTPLKQGESEFKLVTAKDASLGRFSVKMNGHPISGDDSSKNFNFVVSKDE